MPATLSTRSRFGTGPVNRRHSAVFSASVRDGIPDSLDPYPNDSNNGNPPSFWWGGGSFLIDGSWQTFYGQTLLGQLDINGRFPDGDGDGIPDSLDPYPNDSNNSNPPSFWWGGGNFLIDGSWQTFYGQTLLGQLDINGHFPDADGDGIPDAGK